MDTRIPYFTDMVSQFSLIVISQVRTSIVFFNSTLSFKVLLVCVLYPYFAIGFFFVAVSFVMIDLMMNSGVLESKKLDNLMKSPVIHHITSSMAGVNIIRGFAKEEVFEQRFVYIVL